MSIKAIFSNGQVDVYKGKRPVRAAWQVIAPNGRVESGHSLDRAKARKTAEGYAAEMSGCFSIWGRSGGRFPADYVIARERVAREKGFGSYKQYYADVSAKRAAFAASCKIEIVDLKGA
jgi:hypothetical protein